MFTSLDIVGFRDRPIENTFITQDDATGHLAVVLPGLGYRASMPVLYYPGLVLRNAGADLLQVEYNYSDQPDFFNVSENERSTWIRDDVSAALSKALAQRSYDRLTLIGKSLGTIALSRVLGRADELRDAQWIWLTPIVKDEYLRDRISEVKPDSLFIIGTADNHFHQEYLDHVVRATNGRCAVIEGADHSLEIPGDTERSIESIQRVVREVESFIGR